MRNDSIHRPILQRLLIYVPISLLHLAALRSVSLRLQSLNQKTLTEYHWCNGVFSRIRFFDFFLLIYLLIFFWFRLCLDRTRGIIDGFWCEGKCEGRKFTLTLTLILHFLSNRKRSRLQIRMKSRYKSKNKGQKIRVKDSVCICAIREPFLTFVL